MSKIKIKSEIKSKNETHIFKGKGIKTKNKIIYTDNGILTTITLGNIIYLERKKDYYLKLGFCTDKTTFGTYIIPEGKFKIEIKTKKIKIEKNCIKIEYFIKIDNKVYE